ncbi:MAG: hypothetical protein M1826_002392 [Phylliscum demangeonii]|nr:MAG: hypothetical protein M1826_002392 [Phylliscum demangeonii]
MKDAELPFKPFMDFLNYHQKSSRKVSSTMLSDPEHEDELLNLYRPKTNSSCMLESQSMRTKAESQMMLWSKISMKDFVPGQISQNINQTITNSDFKLNRLMMLHNKSLEDGVSSSEINYRRIEYREFKKDNANHFWWPIEMFCYVMANTERKTLNIKMYSNDIISNLKNSEGMISIIRSFITEDI